MNCLFISLFGRFNANIDNNALTGLEANKLQELLSYLLLHRDRQHHRERLASLFWDANSTPQSKKYLRQALWQLRQSLEPCYDENNGLLHMDGDWVSVNTQAHFWLDVHEFERIYNDVRETAGHELHPATAVRIKEALPLYRGNLLEGWYQDWVLFERERLQMVYLGMLDKLMSYCASQREFEEGIYYGNLGLRQDAAQERIHQQLMRLHYLSGNRSTALRQFNNCAEILQSELSVAPSRLTQLLYAQIQNDRLTDEDPPPENPQQRNIHQALLALVQQLSRLRGEIDSMQHQVESQLDHLGRNF